MKVKKDGLKYIHKKLQTNKQKKISYYRLHHYIIVTFKNR
jgi:hypothetical protein